MPSTSSVPSWSIRSGSLDPDRIVATWPAASFSFTRLGRMFTSGLRGGANVLTAARILPPGAGAGTAGSKAERGGRHQIGAERRARGCSKSLLLRLSDEPQVGLHGFEAGGVRLLRLVVGDGGDDDDVLPLLPVHRRRHLVLRRELAGVEEPKHLVEVTAGRHRVRQHGLDLLVRPDDEHRTYGRVVGRGPPLRR